MQNSNIKSWLLTSFKSLLILGLTFSPITGSLKAQCELGKLKIEKTACSAEKTFYVYLNFTYKGNSECFKVSGGGNNYGQFKYSQLPIKIGPLKGDCTTDYEFVVKDCANENCSTFGLLGKVCCETQNCSFSDLNLIKSDCQPDGTFYVTLKFLYKNVGDCFTVQGNGVSYGRFKYNQLPLKIGPLKGDCQTPYEFEVRDCNNEKCSITKELGIVCCEVSEECKLSELEYKKTECNDHGEFFVKLSFKYKNTSDSFDVVDHTGKKHGRFAYKKLPIQIGPFKGDCSTNYILKIFDYKDEKCFLKQEIGVVCCEQNKDCKLSDLKIEKSTCNENKEFYVTLNFNHNNTSDCFTVSGNDHNYGTFNYNDLPITIGPLKGDCTTKYFFVIRDCKNENCAIDGTLGTVCCETQGGDCKLSDLKIEKTPCDENKEFYVYLNFNHKNTSDCFTVSGNDHNYGTFNYGNLPIKIGPLKGDCTTKYFFVIRDCKNENCAIDGTLGTVCCETQGGDCKLSDLKIEKSACNENKEFYVTLNFNHNNTSDCFTVRGNDHNYGTFNYNDLPITIGPLKGDCTTKYFFVIRDCKNENCAIDGTLGTVCCETQGGDCKLSDLKIEKSTCNENKEFYVTLNFNHHNTSDCFTVSGNDHNYGTFNYNELPIKIGPLKGDCTTKYFFVIRDCKNENCAIDGTLGTVCCETQGGDCKLSDLKLEKTACNENKEFYVYLNFKGQNTSDCFTVSGNDHNYGTFNYGNLPIKIGPLKGDCTTKYFFVVRDCHNERCAIEGTLGTVCCETQGGDCMISDLVATRSDCNENGEFFVKLKFNYKNNSECFVVTLNGRPISKHPYSNLPIEIGPFKGDCTTEYIFSVYDCNNEHCAAKYYLGKVCCEQGGKDCKLSEMRIEKTSCNAEKQFYVYLNFAHNNTSDCFTVEGNKVNYGTFKYNDLPIKIGPLKGDCLTEYFFVVRDCEKKECVIEKSLGKVCCETQPGECAFTDLSLTRSDCSSEGTFKIKLNFKYKGGSGCFVVKQNNKVIGKYKVSQLPLEIGPFKGDCITNYNFTIYDCENEKCSIRKEFGRVCCMQTGECGMASLKMEKTSCNENKEFYVYLNFKYKNTSECFTVEGNGVKYGTFNYANLPIKIGPLKGNCETEYEFVIRDCKNERCGISGKLGKVCCDKEGVQCEIFELNALAQECTGPDQYALKINFNHKGTKGIGFDVFDVNGKSIGFYPYNSLPLTIKEFKSSGNEVDYIKVCENDNEKCCAETKIRALDCIGYKPTYFIARDVEIRYEGNYIIMYSLAVFPSGFSYTTTDLQGREYQLKVVDQDLHRIVLDASQLMGGLYLVRTNNSHDVSYFKFIR